MDEIVLEVWGDYACFSQPLGKVERLTYPVPTPSAIRGLLSAIYMKPIEFYWQINRIEVLNPIKYISFKRNEVKCTVNNKPIYTDDERTQRQTVALKDVHYRISASIVPTDDFKDREKQIYEQAIRRIKNGKCFMQPSLGLREFVAYYDDEISEKKPINETMDFGFMIYDVFDIHNNKVLAKTKSNISLYHAVMEDGIIEVPPYDSDKVLKGV